MQIRLYGEEDLFIDAFHEPGMNVNTEGDAHFGALQMFATSLASCTYAVLASYGERIDVGADGLSMRITWRYVEKPFRVGEINMDIRWPGLPESRLDAAQRAAAMCTLHNTLKDCVEIETQVRA